MDTHHFKGNYPDRCSVDGVFLDDDRSVEHWGDVQWEEILPAQKLSAHAEHEFESEVKEHGLVTHVRLHMYPDGGISRLRLFGTIDRGDADA